MMVEFPERKEQCCQCGGHGPSLQLVWAAVGCNSLICGPLGELCDVSGTLFTCNEVWHRGWRSNSLSQHSPRVWLEGRISLLRGSSYKWILLMHQVCTAPFMAGLGFYLPLVYLAASYCLVSPLLLSLENYIFGLFICRFLNSCELHREQKK